MVSNEEMNVSFANTLPLEQAVAATEVSAVGPEQLTFDGYEQMTLDDLAPQPQTRAEFDTEVTKDYIVTTSNDERFYVVTGPTSRRLLQSMYPEQRFTKEDTTGFVLPLDGEIVDPIVIEPNDPDVVTLHNEFAFDMFRKSADDEPGLVTEIVEPYGTIEIKERLQDLQAELARRRVTEAQTEVTPVVETPPVPVAPANTQPIPVVQPLPPAVTRPSIGDKLKAKGKQLVKGAAAAGKRGASKVARATWQGTKKLTKQLASSSSEAARNAHLQLKSASEQRREEGKSKEDKHRGRNLALGGSALAAALAVVTLATGAYEGGSSDQPSAAPGNPDSPKTTNTKTSPKSSSAPKLKKASKAVVTFGQVPKKAAAEQTKRDTKETQTKRKKAAKRAGSSTTSNTVTFGQ